ncbi:MAG: hypothetical protein M0Q13_15715 [Methanothrix sp.]|nr:hypothetical protein [Methanothrix sp.]
MQSAEGATQAQGRTRAWGGVAVVGGNPWERGRARSGPRLGGSPPVRKTARWPGRRGKGAGSWRTLARGAGGTDGCRCVVRGNLLSET